MEQDSNLHMALLDHAEIRAMVHTYVEAKCLKCLNMAQGVGTRRFHHTLLPASGAREEVYSDSVDWSKLLTNFQFNAPSLDRQPCRPLKRA